MNIDNLVISPCCNPDKDLEWVLSEYRKLGFKYFEVFTSWVLSAFDYTDNPDLYINILKKHNMKVTSLHLPAICDCADQAVAAAQFAKAIGAEFIIYKATSKQNYVRFAKEFLDRIESLGITPVIQNHAGSPLESLADFEEVLEGINDERMKALLEVGHFHSVGVSWRQGYELLKQRIALVHIKDQIKRQSVPFGTGEINLLELVDFMENKGYKGKYVVEMEVEDGPNTLKYLKDALDYLRVKA